MRVLVPDAIHGLRVVASPTALDAARWPEGTLVLRFAPDDAFGVAAAGVQVDDPDAIVEADSGWVQLRFDRARFDAHVRPHIEWTLPTTSGVLAQGLVAGVPGKIIIDGDTVVLVCARAYGHELTERLGDG